MANAYRLFGVSLVALGAIGVGCTVKEGSGQSTSAVGATSGTSSGATTTSAAAGTGGATGTGGYGGATGAGGTGVGGTGGYGGAAAATAGAGGLEPPKYDGGGGSNEPITCNSDPNDDACLACVRQQCCAELTACDGDCVGGYNTFFDCRFNADAATEFQTGFSTPYCLEVSGANANTATGDLLSCYQSKCAAGCGQPDENPATWGNFAQKFVEDFCGGCHFPGFKAPTGQDLSEFNTDTTWPEWDLANGLGGDFPPKGTKPDPEGNPDWRTHMDFDAVTKKKFVVWCGVHPDNLPPGCESLQDNVLPPNFFMLGGANKNEAQPGKFPPSGHKNDSHGNPNPCWFADDATPNLTELNGDQSKVKEGTCAQPTHFERARLVSWIFDGTPK